MSESLTKIVKKSYKIFNTKPEFTIIYSSVQEYRLTEMKQKVQGYTAYNFGFHFC